VKLTIKRSYATAVLQARHNRDQTPVDADKSHCMTVESTVNPDESHETRDERSSLPDGSELVADCETPAERELGKQVMSQRHAMTLYECYCELICATVK
jgi:hypothetical protein